ncbi:glycosyltransferase family 2 protein [Candidatus Peregrinibacteria bacterium]|nr:glycosyltransferase family 2 protein [Candidatus Peregrinibacteria bacterium]
MKKNKIPKGTPLVSIVISVYNEGNWLKKTIIDIEDKTQYKNYEIVVMDDNSTDKSCDFLRKKKRKNIRLITNKGKNLGVSRGRHKGAKNAKGELLIFLDGHMLVEEKWLTKIIKEFQNNRNIGILNPMIYNAHKPTQKRKLSGGYTNASISMWAPVWLKGNPLPKKAIPVPFCSACTFCIPKHVYEEIGGFPKWIKGWGPEDRSFSILAYLRGYTCYQTPAVWVGHFYPENLKNDNPELLNMRRENIALNCLKSCYLLYDNKDFGWAQKRLENYAEPFKKFKKALPQLRKQKEKIQKESVRDYQEFTKQFKDRLPYRNIEHFLAGNEHQKNKNFIKALKGFKKASQMKYGVKDYEPHKIKALSLIKITEVLVSQKKYDKALNQALQILKLKEPHPAMLYVLMGRIFCAQELWGNAIFWLKQGEKKKLTNDYKDLVKFNENDFKKGLYDWWGYALFRKKD